jgi:hypothetical protein
MAICSSPAPGRWGLILLITTAVRGREEHVLCNLSSWYEEPQFHGCAVWLSARALASGPAIYLNLTAVSNTWRTIEAQGFMRCRQGVFLAVPALARSADGCEVVPVGDPAPFAGKLLEDEIKLLADHVAEGCLALAGVARRGVSPFCFRYRRLQGIAGAIGRHFGLRHCC